MQDHVQSELSTVDRERLADLQASPSDDRNTSIHFKRRKNKEYQYSWGGKVSHQETRSPAWQGGRRGAKHLPRTDHSSQPARACLRVDTHIFLCTSTCKRII